MRLVRRPAAAALLALAGEVEPDGRLIPLSGRQVARRIQAAALAAGIHRPAYLADGPEPEVSPEPDRAPGRVLRFNARH